MAAKVGVIAPTIRGAKSVAVESIVVRFSSWSKWTNCSQESIGTSPPAASGEGHDFNAIFRIGSAIQRATLKTKHLLDLARQALAQLAPAVE